MSKLHKPEETVAKLRAGWMCSHRKAGQAVADAVRTIGVTEVTYCRWRQRYGGLKTNQVRQMRELEPGHQRLRKAVADLPLGKLLVVEAVVGEKAVS